MPVEGGGGASLHEINFFCTVLNEKKWVRISSLHDFNNNNKQAKTVLSNWLTSSLDLLYSANGFTGIERDKYLLQSILLITFYKENPKDFVA